MGAVRIPSQMPRRLLGTYSHKAEPIAVMPDDARGRAGLAQSPKRLRWMLSSSGDQSITNAPLQG